MCQNSRIKLVIPYFGYARQDKIFKPGEPMTARAVATALNPFLKNGQVHLVNIHAPSILNHFNCQAGNLGATPLLAEKVASIGLKNLVVISPDKGAVAMAKTAAACLGVESDYLQKTRLSATEVSMAPKEIEVRGRDVVIFDDMIATGGTMATAIEMLRGQGAARVYLAAVHPVLTGSSVLKLYRSGVAGVLATDTLIRSEHCLCGADHRQGAQILRFKVLTIGTKIAAKSSQKSHILISKSPPASPPDLGASSAHPRLFLLPDWQPAVASFR